jgi:hypothetical protein
MNKEFKRMMELAGLAEMKINDPSDLSNSTTFKHYLNRIPNEKYFYVADEEANTFFDPNEDKPNYIWDEIDQYYDWDLVDYFYDPIFDNELKGKPGIEGDNFNEWQDIEIEHDPNEYGTGVNVGILIHKIMDIISDYKKKHFSHLAN